MSIVHITHVTHGPLMMTVQDFAYLHGVSPSTLIARASTKEAA